MAMNLLEKVQRFAASPSLEYEQKITLIAYNLAENRCADTEDLVGCIAHIFPDMQRDLMRGIGIQVDGHCVSGSFGGNVVVCKRES
jgi:hypothetical protein